VSAGSLALGWFIYDRMCKSRSVERQDRWRLPSSPRSRCSPSSTTAFFSDRAAFLHVGALIGTIMAASVFAVIIPNQKKVVADLMAGGSPIRGSGSRRGSARCTTTT
jgi:uncharacterized membrane protein